MDNQIVEIESNQLVEVENKDTAVEVLMTKDEAIELTGDIKSTSTALYVLLKKAHDNKAWISMGYKSWSEYISSEFEFSRTRSYQLINQANVIEEINEASGVPLYISERDARSIKKRLPEITQKIKEVDKDDLNDDEIEEKVKEIIEDEKEEIDMAAKEPRYNDEDNALDEEDSGAMEEWKPDGIDMDKMERMLSDEDQFFFNNLIDTLKIFDSMPEPTKFGADIKKSSQDTKELIKLAGTAFSWITQLLDEVE